MNNNNDNIDNHNNNDNNNNHNNNYDNNDNNNFIQVSYAFSTVVLIGTL